MNPQIKKKDIKQFSFQKQVNHSDFCLQFQSFELMYNYKYITKRIVIINGQNRFIYFKMKKKKPHYTFIKSLQSCAKQHV